MYPFLQLGPVAIPTKPFLYLLGIWWGLSVLEWFAARRGLPAARVHQTAVIAVAAGFITARLAFVAQNWASYAGQWLGLIWPLHEGYLPVAGWVGAAVALLFALRATQLSPAEVGDAAVPTLLSWVAIHSLADGLAGPGRGQASNWLFAQHPIQLYEMLWVGLVAWVWWRLHARQPFAGWGLAVATAGVAFGRLLLTPLRADLLLTAGGWSVAQMAYLAVMSAALIWLAVRSPSSPNEIPS
ncbi:MAG: prolipoprotein diacylglyceryl transferase [Chloroflexi bacterium]|nr:prolipoprotein diacylglyceryl transferase [Chloroflexota bacterium]